MSKENEIARQCHTSFFAESIEKKIAAERKTFKDRTLRETYDVDITLENDPLEVLKYFLMKIKAIYSDSSFVKIETNKTKMSMDKDKFSYNIDIIFRKNKISKMCDTGKTTCYSIFLSFMKEEIRNDVILSMYMRIDNNRIPVPLNSKEKYLHFVFRQIYSDRTPDETNTGTFKRQWYRINEGTVGYVMRILNTVKSKAFRNDFFLPYKKEFWNKLVIIHFQKVINFEVYIFDMWLFCIWIIFKKYRFSGTNNMEKTIKSSYDKHSEFIKGYMKVKFEMIENIIERKS